MCRSWCYIILILGCIAKCGFIQLISFANSSTVLLFMDSVLFLPSEDRRIWFLKSCYFFDSVQEEIPDARRDTCSQWKLPIFCLLRLYLRSSESSCWIRDLQGPGSHHSPATAITPLFQGHHPLSLTITHHPPTPTPLPPTSPSHHHNQSHFLSKHWIPGPGLRGVGNHHSVQSPLQLLLWISGSWAERYWWIPA